MTIRRRVKSERIPHLRLGRKYVFDLEDIERYERAHKIGEIVPEGER